MEQKEGRLSFGEDIGAGFHLQIRVDVQGQRHLMLRHGTDVVPGVLKPTLSLLQYLAEHPGDLLSETEITQALGDDNVEKYMSLLRGHLGDDPHQPRFIKTIPKQGYRFIVNVTREGDLGVEVFPRWRPSIFFDLLKKVTRGNGPEEEDLRIVTSAFSCGVQDLMLDEMLRKEARIRIVMMNPLNRDLLIARHGLRTDGLNPDKGKLQIDDQIQALKLQKRNSTSKNHKGTLELRVSDAMPAGIIAHSKSGAVTGMFIAQGSYVFGPMIEVSGGTDLWQTLYEDWYARWKTGASIDLDS